MAAIKTRYRLLMRIHSPKNDRLSRRGARRWPFAAAKARARAIRRGNCEFSRVKVDVISGLSPRPSPKIAGDLVAQRAWPSRLVFHPGSNDSYAGRAERRGIKKGKFTALEIEARPYRIVTQ